MNKYWLHITLCILLSTVFLGCQKATLIEDENQESDISGRNTNDESSDSTTVTPEFDINGWEGTIDADFTFGGKETGIWNREKLQKNLSSGRSPMKLRPQTALKKLSRHSIRRAVSITAWMSKRKQIII